MHDRKTTAIANFQNLIGTAIFVCPWKKLLRAMYQIAPIFAEETESSKKANVSRGSIGVLCRRHHRKITNAFGISRASVSAIIKGVPHTWTIKLSTTENKVINKLLGTHKFPHCIGTIYDSHIEMALLNEYYSDYISRKGQIWTFKLCATKNISFVIKWSGSVNDFRIFFYSSVKKMLWKQYQHVKSHRSDSSFPIRWLCISSAPIYHGRVFRL